MQDKAGCHHYRAVLFGEVKDILQVRSCAVIVLTELDFAKQNKKKFSMCTKGCKNYMASHVFKKISVSEIAGFLGIRAIYLGRVFQKEEKMTITAYPEGKDRPGENLLIFWTGSSLKSATIQSFLSQSHLGKVFCGRAG